MTDIVKRTLALEASMDPEDSHFFLSKLQHQSWYRYSSQDMSIDDVVAAIQSYVLFHAAVSFPEKLISKFWTPTPIGTFRYVMDSNGHWHELSEFNPYPGYLVQGCYWTNGFYYIVSNGDFLLEANLFVDKQTKEQYNYL